ncbi:hypothetical protein D3C75_738280 [compost metagenome]
MSINRERKQRETLIRFRQFHIFLKDFIQYCIVIKTPVVAVLRVSNHGFQLLRAVHVVKAVRL